MTTVKVKIKLITDFLGTVTKDPDVYKTYIESKKPEIFNGEDEYLTVDKIEQKGWTGFHRDENGLFFYDYMIRGFLKNAGNILKDSLKLKNVKSKIDNCVFVFPRRIYFNQQKPDGFLERPLRAMTMQGPRVTLARSDYIKEGKEIEFELQIVDNKEINTEIIREIFEYGKLSGLGQFRNGSYGRFEIMEYQVQ